MGRRQPKLTAAIILALIAAAAGVLIWTYSMTYTSTSREHFTPSPDDLVRAASLSPGEPHRMLDRERRFLVAELTRRGFSQHPTEPETYSRRTKIPATGHLVDELIRLTVDPETDTVIGAFYIRTTDAPIEEPYVEEIAP